jgi:hypothetical protein
MCAVLLAVLLVGGSGERNEQEVGPAAGSGRQDSAVERDEVRTGGIADVLSANFGVFRLPASLSDIPGRNRGSVGPADVETRRVGPTTHAEVFAAPGADSLCMIIDDGQTGSGRTCNPLGQVLDHGVHASSAAPGPGSERVVYGIVPDWVTEVVAIAPDGKEVSAVPSRNGYQLRVPARTSQGMLARADGSTVPFEIVQP